MNQDHGLFPSSSVEFESLLRRTPSRARTPFVPTPAKEQAEYDAQVKSALQDRVRRQEFEERRLELARIITSLCYDELVAETNKDAGTESTRSTYKSDFGAFQSWCADQQLPSLPTAPEVLAIYLITRANEGAKPERLARMVSSVRYIHSWSNLAVDADDVIVRATMRWIRRRYTEQKEIDKENKSTQRREPEPQGAFGSGKSH